MTGKTHKEIGFAVGAAMVYYAVAVDQPLYALGMVAAPVGAMLPDIDHNNSQMGRDRAFIMAVIKKCAHALSVIGAVAVAVCSLLASTEGVRLAAALLAAGLVGSVSLSDFMKEKFPFFAKHRGIMHTALLVVVFGVFAVKSDSEWLQVLMTGLGLGYLSHLVADSLTVTGCPLAWPISKECISFAKIRTGTKMEYVGALVMNILILVYVKAIVTDVRNAGWVFGVFSICVGEAIYKRALSADSRQKRQAGNKVKVVAIVAVVVAIVVAVTAFAKGSYGVTALIAGCMLGMLKGKLRV